MNRGRPTVVLWGDSHAWHYLAGLDARGRGAGVNLVAFVRGGARPSTRALADAPEYASTTSLLGRRHQVRQAEPGGARQAREAVRGRGPTRLIMAARWEGYLGAEPISLVDRIDPTLLDASRAYRPRLESSLAPTMSEVSDSVVGIELVLSSPEFARDVPLCAFAPSRPFDCTVSVDQMDDYRQRRRPASRAGASDGGRRRRGGADPSSGCATTRLCPVERRSTGCRYFDDDHLSGTGRDRSRRGGDPRSRTWLRLADGSEGDSGRPGPRAPQLQVRPRRYPMPTARPGGSGADAAAGVLPRRDQPGRSPGGTPGPTPALRGR